MDEVNSLRWSCFSFITKLILLPFISPPRYPEDCHHPFPALAPCQAFDPGACNSPEQLLPGLGLQCSWSKGTRKSLRKRNILLHEITVCPLLPEMKRRRTVLGIQCQTVAGDSVYCTSDRLLQDKSREFLPSLEYEKVILRRVRISTNLEKPPCLEWERLVSSRTRQTCQIK